MLKALRARREPGVLRPRIVIGRERISEVRIGKCLASSLGWKGHFPMSLVQRLRIVALRNGNGKILFQGLRDKI